MKKLIIAALAASTTALTAPVIAGGHVPVAAECAQKVSEWGGWKLGAQLGYGHAATSYSQGTTSADLAAKGVEGGVHVGYDYQFMTDWIVGLEAAFNWAGLKGTINGTTTGVDTQKMRYDIAVMARIGYVLHDSLLYLGLGWEGASWKFSDSTAPATSSTKFKNGFRLALGAAQKVTDHIVLGLEGGYTWFGSTSVTDGAGNVDKFKPRVLDAKIKLSYML